MKNDFEDFLQYKHMEDCPMVLDDDLPDHFNDWLTELDIETWLKFGEEYGREQVKLALEKI
jgi:hypothetical protein